MIICSPERNFANYVVRNEASVFVKLGARFDRMLSVLIFDMLFVTIPD